jgi:hypothetical protein
MYDIKIKLRAMGGECPLRHSHHLKYALDAVSGEKASGKKWSSVQNVSR